MPRKRLRYALLGEAPGSGQLDEPCARTNSILPCLRTASRCGRRRRATRRDFSWCVRARAAVELEDRIIGDLPSLLRSGDALVVNDTKVLPANLHGRRLGRGGSGDREPAIAATLIKRLDGSRWRALVRPAKRLKPGDVVRFGAEGRVCFLEQLDATVEEKGEGVGGGEVTFAFAFHGAALDDALAERGDMPLPPYIGSRRTVDERDRTDYQTMFAHEEGSVAAPTAGLHFTENLVQALRERGIALHRVTLHVGPGTFLPVKADDTSGHRMHPEWGAVSAETAAALNATRRAGGRIVAVGSTSLRLIESAAAEDGTLAAYCGETALFITPGYRFRAVDAMLTNFHLPRSTLFMLVAAPSAVSTSCGALMRTPSTAAIGSIPMATPACCFGRTRA